jgi:adenosylcobinamide-GDP ribazoletransferase
MRRLLAAVAFLTRFPVPVRFEFGAEDVGRAALLFPLVGAMLGALAVGLRYVLYPTLPPLLAAALLVAAGALVTGALHLDGLADMADGFGGGQTREDVLRIMRDHVIGAYGGVALILLILTKTAAVAALVEAGRADAYLVVAPALARWATVPLARLLPYARREGGTGAAVTEHVGWTEVVGATAIAAVVTWGLAGLPGAACAAAVAAVSALGAILCLRRIGGITGDTLGANTEACETVVLVVAVGFA